MEKQTQTTDIPKWSALLVEAVNKPGLIMDAYSAFWNYRSGQHNNAFLRLFFPKNDANLAYLL